MLAARQGHDAVCRSLVDDLGNDGKMAREEAREARAQAREDSIKALAARYLQQRKDEFDDMKGLMSSMCGAIWRATGLHCPCLLYTSPSPRDS